MKQEELIKLAVEYANDPLGFTLAAYEWPDDQDGPDTWQINVLEELRDTYDIDRQEAFRKAIASGHGVGKTALSAWMIIWFAVTKPHCSGVVTANTSSQLVNKTWREVGVWLRRCHFKDWFEYTASRLRHKQFSEWQIVPVTNSPEAPERFAGLHARYVLMIFDEASAIEKPIWETAVGATSTPGCIWLVMGNPTRAEGEFFECFHKNRHLWSPTHVSCIGSKMVTPSYVAYVKEAYGDDSDVYRVRVLGQFPEASMDQLIARGFVERAVERFIDEAVWSPMPRIMGVDVARFGSNKTVITKRQGRMVIEVTPFAKRDLAFVAGVVQQHIDEWEPDMVIIDGDGLGAGVVDILRNRKYQIEEFRGGKAAREPSRYVNARSEAWDKMREWFWQDEISVPNIQELIDDCCAPLYYFDPSGRMGLEKKEDMEKRGLQSPDYGDSLALTFGFTPRITKPVKEGVVFPKRVKKYDPLSHTYNITRGRR